MVVAWIPLENDCGVTKPTISILANKKTSQTFHLDLNQLRLPAANTRAPSTADLNERFNTFNQSIVTPICNLGDIIVFDGLTFHCTSSSPDFISDRYAPFFVSFLLLEKNPVMARFIIATYLYLRRLVVKTLSFIPSISCYAVIPYSYLRVHFRGLSS